MSVLLSRPCALPLLLGSLVLPLHSAMASDAGDAAALPLTQVTILGGRPSSLPVQIATTIESAKAAQIAASVNAVDAEDALKYFPSLNVRKRFAGDYDHAVLASRASGSGNSARSLVYADGILLSNLLGNGATYTPRWGMVSPEEIERVDVLYGPFSAAYPGNAVGAVVDYVTRMPRSLEVHAKVSGFGQSYSQHGNTNNYHGRQGSFSVGNKTGKLAWWLSLSELDNDSQPIGFATRLVSDGVPGAGGTAVSGALHERNPSNRDWLLLGATNQVHTRQDNAKLKLAYDLTPSVLASYTFGLWRNDVDRHASSYLKDASGRSVTSGAINIDQRRYQLSPADFAPATSTLEHLMQGAALKSHTRGIFDWEVSASRYDYQKDLIRTPTVALDGAGPRAGTVTDLEGTGWTTLAAKGVWRPDGHIVEFGAQRDAFRLRTKVSAVTDWQGGAAQGRLSAFNGDTRLESLFVQDTWRFAPGWKSTVGGRLERWQAFGGELANAGKSTRFAPREQSAFSPKLALARELGEAWTVKGSLGRAVRFPTVAELFQGAYVGDTVTLNDPNLKPEKSWTTELNAERRLDDGLLRATLFREETTNALYSQRNVNLTPSVTNIQNVGAIETNGVELAGQWGNVLKNLDLNASVTYADSIIRANPNFPQSVGKQQPRVPAWRGNLLATWRPVQSWSASFGARYSGRQYGTLDNSDPHGDSYTGYSSFLVADVRLRHQIDKHWTAAVGIDNLANKKYWAYHPYTQRTLLAELQYDLR